MSLTKLIKNTNAYRILSAEKERNSISHAYLLLCEDAVCLKKYLKIFAKIIMCDEKEFCGDCRSCRLIEKEAYADCTFYPTEKDKILTADIDDLVSQSYIKPLENKRRLFVLCGAESMNASAQNKLLKTLEEPPANVVILLGATTEYTLLPTIKSRVERLEIPLFDKKAIKEALKGEYTDIEKLDNAVRLCGGKVGNAISLYESGEGDRISELAKSIIYEMKSSKDVLKFADKINKDNVNELIATLKEEFGEMQRRVAKENVKEIYGFTLGAMVAIEELLDQKQKALAFNANLQMSVDGILFGIAEEKYKWRKL